MKVRLFGEYDDSPVFTIVYINLIKHRVTRLFSDGSKIIEIEVV